MGLWCNSSEVLVEAGEDMRMDWTVQQQKQEKVEAEEDMQMDWMMQQ